MADIKWLEITVNTTPDQLDQVSAKLTALPCIGDRIFSSPCASFSSVNAVAVSGAPFAVCGAFL